MRKFFMGVLACVFLVGCDEQANPASAASQEQSVVNAGMVQLLRNQPPPVFDYSPERADLIKLYTARQRRLPTFSYVQSPYTGKLLWKCPSVGFPLPYSTQLTNPVQTQWKYQGGGGIASAVVAQAEPNGLYPPPTSDATWVLCVNKAGQIVPKYEEKHVTASFVPMHEENGTLVDDDDATPSFVIDPKRP